MLDGQAVGNVAKEMLGKAPASVEVVRPLRDGVIADFDITEAMLRYFIQKVHGNRSFVRPRVVIAVPYGITHVERRAVYSSAERAGARKVYLIEEPRAAGIGAGLPIEEPTANMIVDIGGGTTEIAVLSLTDIVIGQSIKVGGDKFDEAISDYVRKNHNLLIGEQTAEKIKIHLASCEPLEQEKEMEVRGRNLLNGRPSSILLSSQEVREAIQEPLSKIVRAIENILENTSPELAADLVEKGITLSGGGAKLHKIDSFIARQTGLQVLVPDDPLGCVARGTGVFIENLDYYAQVIEESGEAA